VNIESARSALEAAAAAAKQAAGVGNYLIRGPSLNAAEVTRFDVIDTMAATIVTDLVSYIDKLTGRQIIPYDPSYQTNPSQLLVEDLPGIADLAVLDAIIRGDDVDDDRADDAVIAMAHSIGTGNDKLIAYRVKGPGIATRRKKWVQLIPRDGIYEPIDGEVLIYEPRFDVVTCGGYAYFTTVTLIQSQLNADSKARGLARDALAAATAKVKIAGIDQLEKAVMDDPAMRLKMAAVARLIAAEPDYVKHLTTRNLVAFIEANPDYNIPLVESGGKRILKFDSSAQRRHQIPKLLADDFLHSELTNRNYEAGSKHRVQQ
jgi:hypothetical protein